VTASSEAAQDRLRCVMLVSGSQDQDKLIMEDWIAVSKEHSFQFHAFNLVAQHDAGRFLRVADQGAGTYHYLADANIITDAFTAFVGGLKSVVATSVKLSLKAEAGFSISSVETGGHYCWWDGSSEHGIHIADMHAGEQRSFMVYLRGAAAVREQEAAVTDENSKLLTIHAEYLQGSSKKTLRRPCLLLRGKDDDVAMKSEVAAEMVRVKLVKQVKEMVAKAEAHELMKDKWEMMRASAEYEDARGTALLELIEKDVDEMMKKPQCQPHMVSWLSCHWWQRATAMPHYTRAFSSRRARTTSSNGAIALGIAGVVLVCFVMLMLMLRRPTGITPSLNVTAALDVVNHPQWPAMEDDLSLMLGRANEDRITSFFKSASKSDMSQQIDQYLYMVRRRRTLCVDESDLDARSILIIYSLWSMHGLSAGYSLRCCLTRQLRRHCQLFLSREGGEGPGGGVPPRHAQKDQVRRATCPASCFHAGYVQSNEPTPILGTHLARQSLLNFCYRRQSLLNFYISCSAVTCLSLLFLVSDHCASPSSSDYACCHPSCSSSSSRS